MKKIFSYLIVGLYMLSGSELSAQGVFTQKFDPGQYVYWFFIRAESKFDKETKRPIYVVRTLSKMPKSGTISVYEKEVWKYLQGGQQLAVGPFLEFNDAKRAIAAYDLAKLPKEKMEEEVANFKDSTITVDEFYWYFLKFKIAQRTHKYILERTAAAVATGGLNEFLHVFLEGVTFEQLAMGPFSSQIEAEESKRLNRLEEK
jgi:hypothetical protein